MRWLSLLAIVLLATGAARADSVQSVDSALCADMKAHHVLNPNAPVGCDRLALVTFAYVGFDGATYNDGRIVVMDAVAPRVLRIFQELRGRRFPIAKARLLNAYDGDDDASMADDNSSGFNHRNIPGTSQISLHAYGAAIDINPVENPFITRAGATFTAHPPASADYLNRLQHRPGKPDRPGLAEEVVKVFAANGFVDWGGTWDDPLDFQHFDIGRTLAETLTAQPPAEARRRFEESITGHH